MFAAAVRAIGVVKVDAIQLAVAMHAESCNEVRKCNLKDAGS
jgi:hypothetical protein